MLRLNYYFFSFHLCFYFFFFWLFQIKATARKICTSYMCNMDCDANFFLSTISSFSARLVMNLLLVVNLCHVETFTCPDFIHHIGVFRVCVAIKIYDCCLNAG